jgi:hypothetical protein
MSVLCVSFMQGGSHMKRVEVTRPILGICHMIVCAEADCADEEILAEANDANPSGTDNGWTHVIRENEPPSDFWPVDKLKPVQCADDPNRKHFVLSC